MRNLRERKLRGLAQKLARVLEHQFVDGSGVMSAAAHFESGFRYGEWITDAPIAGAIHPNPFVAVHLYDVNGTGGSAFGFGIKGHACPHTGVEHQLDRV